LNAKAPPISGIKSAEVVSRSAGSQSHKHDLLAEEVPVALAYNGISHAVMMASPCDLEDFARGFSLTEGIVESFSDILDIQVNKSAKGIELNIELLSRCFTKLKDKRRQISGRTGCGLCGIESLEALPSNKVSSFNDIQLGVLPQFKVVNKAIDALLSQQEMQMQCGAVHAAALVDDDGQVLLAREDVGRHNALDKLIGAMNEAINAEQFILISSRASYEMVMKAARINCASLVAISAPTSLAVEMCETLNINLIGFVRGQRQIIYHQQRTSTCAEEKKILKA